MTELEYTTRPLLTGGETAGRRFLTIEQAHSRTASRIASGDIDFADMEQKEARTNGRN